MHKPKVWVATIMSKARKPHIPKANQKQLTTATQKIDFVQGLGELEMRCVINFSGALRERRSQHIPTSLKDLKLLASGINSGLKAHGKNPLTEKELFALFHN